MEQDSTSQENVKLVETAILFITLMFLVTRLHLHAKSQLNAKDTIVDGKNAQQLLTVLMTGKTASKMNALIGVNCFDAPIADLDSVVIKRPMELVELMEIA